MNRSFFKRLASYVLVATLASGVTFWLCRESGQGQSKLEQLQLLIAERYVDASELDMTKLEDAAAEGMLSATGDRWSYYIPASEFAALMEQKQNSYVGIGVTISVREDKLGFDIVQVEPGGGAQEAGVLPGDILVAVEGQDAAILGTAGCRELIRGEEGTRVNITVLRDGERLDFSLVRKTIRVAVATGEMLENNVGLITIANFDDRCAAETKKAIEALCSQGATALIFDVRNNPGGYKHELVDILDYLLPEDLVLFRSRYFNGNESTDYSDSHYLEMPMAVLINSESYSAAEFFAAALAEHEWAITVGDATCGKGNYQNTFQFTDGSGVALSTGKYFTPKGVSLADVGGLLPQVPVAVTQEQAALIYAGLVEPEDDPQIQAAVNVLLAKED